jgi:hypothetical protein
MQTITLLVVVQELLIKVFLVVRTHLVLRVVLVVVVLVQ